MLRMKMPFMIEISFLTAELIFTAVWLIVRIAVWCRQRRIDRKREVLLLLMYVNLAVLIRLTFFPMMRLNGHVQPLVFYPGEIFPLRINLLPFVHLLDYDNRRDTLLNVIGNLTMFIPSGIVLPVLWKRLDSFPKTVCAGAGISLCIELLQLPFSSRASDADDLILNTLGVVIGYGIYRLFRKCVQNRKKTACKG